MEIDICSSVHVTLAMTHLNTRKPREQRAVVVMAVRMTG